ncbi:hypothetical protein Ntsu_48360 [Nocardia sp. IFM 10818]
MQTEAVAQVADVCAPVEVAGHVRVDIADRDHLVVHALDHQHGHGGSRCAGTDLIEDDAHLGMSEECVESRGQMPVGIAAHEPGQQREGRQGFGALQQGQVIGRELPAQNVIQSRIGPPQAGGEDHGESGEGRAVQARERGGRITDGGARHRSGDIEFRGVGARQLRGPRRGQTAAGVSPQADSGARVQAERAEPQGGPHRVQGPVAGFAGGAEMPLQPTVIGDRDRPAAFQRAGDERQLDLRNRAEGAGAVT